MDSEAEVTEYEVTDTVGGGMWVGDRYVRWYYEPSKVTPRDDEERHVLDWLVGHGMALRVAE